MKKRLFVTIAIGVALAIIVAVVSQVWLIRSALRTERDPQSIPGLLHPASGRLVGAVDDALARVDADADADLDALAERVGGPVRLVTPAPDALPHLVVVADDRRLRVSRDAEGVFYVWPEGAAQAFALGPFEGGVPWPIRDERLTIFLLLVLVVAVLFSLPVTLPIARGLDRLRDAARRFSAGDLDARSEPRGPIREVAVAFNAMAARTQQLLESQRHLLEAVSHELRTPTARIRFALEMLQDAPDGEARAKRFATIDRDLTELDELVGELLTYTRVTGRGEAGDPEPVDAVEILGELVRDGAERHAHLAFGLEAEDDAPIAVPVEAHLFRRAARNLLLNAARYAHSRVVVSVTRDAAGVLVSVSDDGPGVAEDDRERIFDPFARGDQSRARGSGGVGLGLAIVRRILEVHGGEIRVDRDPALGGARFVTTWPTRG